MFHTNTAWRHLGVLWAAAILCMTPRFARTDTILGMSFRWLTTETLGDAGEYAQSVLYYRGLGPPGESPFSLRPLTPWLASFLPLEPFSALAVVGAAGILIGVTAMYALALYHSGDGKAAFLTTGLYATSFPVFYYTTVGTVDPLTFGLATLSVALIAVFDRPLLAILVAGLAAANKEVGLVAVGFGVPFLLLDARRAIPARIALAAVMISAALLGWYLSRRLAPPVEAFSWPLLWSAAYDNLMRLKTTGALILSFGIQSAIIVYLWLRAFRFDWTYLSDPYKWGFATAFALGVYGYFVGQTDGRFIWYGQIFTTPVLASVLASNWSCLPMLARQKV